MKLKRMAKRVLALALTSALVITGAAINSNGASAAKKVTLKLNKKKATVNVGKKVTLKVTKKNVKSAKITWKTSKKAVATVSKKGVVTGKKSGKATISAKITYKAKGSNKSKKKTLKCTVTVTAKNPTAGEDKTPGTGTSTPNASATPGATASQAPTKSGDPAGTGTPAPGANNTDAPAGTGTPAPDADGTDAPAGTGTPAPDADGTDAPADTGTPAPDADGTDAPTGTPAPDADNTDAPAGTGTPAPDADTTDAPTGTGTPAPDADGTDAPAGTGTPAPDSDASAAPAPKTVQSLKITVKAVSTTEPAEETILTNAVVTIKDASDKPVAAIKGADGIYTTDKLSEGTYTVSVADIPLENGVEQYGAVSQSVTIPGSADTEEQNVIITMTAETITCFYWHGELKDSETENAFAIKTDRTNMARVSTDNEAEYSPQFEANLSRMAKPTIMVTETDGYAECSILPYKSDSSEIDWDAAKIKIWYYDNADGASKDLTELLKQLTSTEKVCIEYKKPAKNVYIYDAAVIDDPTIY